MALLRNIESKIAGLVEGAFGRVFRSEVQPVELARRLVKEMDDHQQTTLRQVLVPDVYDVYLSARDLEHLGPTVRRLSGELAEYLAEHARRQGYGLAGRPRVTLRLDRDLDLGAFGIATSMSDQREPAPDAPASDESPAGSTMVFRPPHAAAPAAPAAPEPLQVVTPDGVQALDRDVLRVGRGKSNEIVIGDASVSREHAEFVRTPEGWTIRDLDSTNGVRVNGSKVARATVAAGDRIILGNVQVSVERRAAGVRT